MKRWFGSMLAIILVLLPAISAQAEGPQVTIGLLPKVTSADKLTIRGISPRGKEVTLSVNGVEAARVYASLEIDRYFSNVPLVAGENHVVVSQVDDPSNRAEVNVFRTTVAFADMSTHWANTEVAILATLGIVNGIGDNNFGPDLSLTRVQFAKMVVLGLGLQTEPGAELTFTDRDQIADWGHEYVAAAVKAGLLKGYEDGSFQPNKALNRLELAVIVSRGLRLKGIEGGLDLGFADVFTIPVWAMADVGLAVHAKVITGFEDNTFRPMDGATRGQSAVMIRRLMLAQVSP